MFIKKNKDFIILSLILIPSVGYLLKGCDNSIWNWVPENIQGIFIKKAGDEVWYNLSLGYVISYIFFLVVNFLPDRKRGKEKQRELLPLKCARYREIELLMQDISMIWGDIFKSCIRNGIIDRNQIKKIDDLYNFSMIKKTLPYINLFQPAIFFGITKVSWSEKIETGIKLFKTDANTYLTRYKDMEPTTLFFNIFYILNTSFILGQLPILINVAFHLYGIETSLDKVIAADNLKEQIEKSCRCIININTWLYEEYEYLIRNVSDANSILKEYDFLKELDK